LAAGTFTQPRLLTTTDGGATWNVRELPGNVPMNLDFVDGSHGWATPGRTGQEFQLETSLTGAVPLYETLDGGATWHSVPNDLHRFIGPLGNLQSSPQRLSPLYKLDFVDGLNGFASSPTNEVPALLRTVDGGRTWSVVCQKMDYPASPSHCSST